MTFLPIVERELRVRARWRSTFRIRVGGALLGSLLVSAFLLLGSFSLSPGRAGMIMFALLGNLAFLGCLFEGIRTTADCLSEEKRSGTLGLLFLTDLKGYDVVLGKWMASSLDSIYRLLAIFPPLAVPIIVGGVTGGEFWRLVLVLTHTLFFSLSAGILVSILSYEERRAWLATLMLVGGTALAPLVLPGWLSGGRHPWLVPSPTAAFRFLFDSVYSYAPQRFWFSLLGLHGLCWLCLGLASVLSPHLWREPVEGTGLFPSRRWEGRWARPWAPVRRAPRSLALDPDPVAWLVERMDRPGRFLWALVGIAALAGLIWWVGFGLSKEVAAVLLLLALGMHFTMAAGMAARACHAVAQTRDSGMLELLLGTPLTVPQIIQGLHTGLWRAVRRPVIALAVVEFLILAVNIILLAYEQDDMAGVGGRVSLSALFFGAVLGASLLDLWAVSRFGLWMGLATQKPSQALTKTVLYVLVLPWMVGACCWVLWPVLILVKDLVLIRIGKDRLHRRFREIVMGGGAGEQVGAFFSPAEAGLPRAGE